MVGNARSAERLAHAARQLGNPPRFLGVAGDIGHPDTARALFDRATQAFGKVDVLVNNAGIFIAKPLGEYTTDDADALFSTNLKGFFYPSQQAAAHMAAHGGGHIVNITASIALQPQQQAVSYTHLIPPNRQPWAPRARATPRWAMRPALT